MNNSIAKDQFSFSLGDLSYIDPTYDEGSTVPTVGVREHRAKWIGRVLSKLTEWQRRRAVVQEMAMMTDRELSDIGLSRADLDRIFDPNFATDHARGRDYVAY